MQLLKINFYHQLTSNYRYHFDVDTAKWRGSVKSILFWLSLVFYSRRRKWFANSKSNLQIFVNWLHNFAIDHPWFAKPFSRMWSWDTTWIWDASAPTTTYRTFCNMVRHFLNFDRVHEPAIAVYVYGT